MSATSTGAVGSRNRAPARASTRRTARSRTFLVLVALTVLVQAAVVLSAQPAAATAPDWVHQLGTPSDDSGDGVAVDTAGNIYTTGYTTGTLPSSPDTNAGWDDVFVASWTSTGVTRWVHQLGTPGRDRGTGITVDSAGNVYVTGLTEGTLPGSPDTNAGPGFDVFVASWTSTGATRWVHQLGTPNPEDLSEHVAVDSAGNVYVTGYTTGTLPGSPDTNAGYDDVFVASWTSTGATRWVHQIGTPGGDRGTGVTVDSAGNVYVTGLTDGTLPGSPDTNPGPVSDVFVASWTSTGATRWVHQLGTPLGEFGHGLAVDSAGNVYVTGNTAGTLPGSPETNTGAHDVFVASWTSTGTTRWVHQLGTPDPDGGNGVAVDTAGNVYITGYTAGALPGSPETNAGDYDVFVASWTSTGTTRWIHQLGTPGTDGGSGVAVDSAGHAYVTGYTGGTLPGAPETNAGFSDPFLARWATATPPATDTVAFSIAGAVNYTNNQNVSGGNVAIVRDRYGIARVTGTVTFASSVSGSAQAWFEVNRFFLTAGYTGSVRISDPGAAISLTHPIQFSRVYRVGATGATNVQSWTVNRWPYRQYWLTWTVHDLA